MNNIDKDVSCSGELANARCTALPRSSTPEQNAKQLACGPTVWPWNSQPRDYLAPVVMWFAAAGLGLVSAIGSVIHRATDLERYDLFHVGPATPMAKVLPCSMESVAGGISLGSVSLMLVLSPFPETGCTGVYLALVTAIIFLQRGLFALGLGKYYWTWVTGHFLSITCGYLAFLMKAAESSSDTQRRWRHVGTAVLMLLVTTLNHVHAYYASPLFRTGYVTVAISEMGIPGNLTTASGMLKFVLYATAWLLFASLTKDVNAAVANTRESKRVLDAGRYYVLGSCFMRLPLGRILNGPDGLRNAWMWEDFVVNFPCLVYALVVLHCITLSSAHQLQMRAAVEEAQRRQTVAEKVAEGRDQFVRYIFHEVRVPFNTVRLGLDHLLDVQAHKMTTRMQAAGETGVSRDADAATAEAAVEDEEEAETLQLMKEATTNMQRILDDVLTIQKMQAGEFQLALSSVDMRALLVSVVRIFMMPAEQAGSTLVLGQLDDDLPPAVLADEHRLFQVLCNLVSNALKFVPSRRGRVSLSARVVRTMRVPLQCTMRSCQASGDGSGAAGAAGVEVQHRRVGSGCSNDIRHLGVVPTVDSQQPQQPTPFSPTTEQQVASGSASRPRSLSDVSQASSATSQTLSLGPTSTHSITTSGRIGSPSMATGGAGGTALKRSITVGGSSSSGVQVEERLRPLLPFTPRPRTFYTVHDTPQHRLQSLASEDVALVELSCTDNGCGLSQSDQERLFKPFVQIDAGVRQKGKGTGLGLSICREIVEKLGGSISVASTLGQGSTFSVTVPLRILRVPIGSQLGGVASDASSSGAIPAANSPRTPTATATATSASGGYQPMPSSFTDRLVHPSALGISTPAGVAQLLSRKVVDTSPVASVMRSAEALAGTSGAHGSAMDTTSSPTRVRVAQRLLAGGAGRGVVGGAGGCSKSLQTAATPVSESGAVGLAASSGVETPTTTGNGSPSSALRSASPRLHKRDIVDVAVAKRGLTGSGSSDTHTRPAYLRSAAAVLEGVRHSSTPTGRGSFDLLRSVAHANRAACPTRPLSPAAATVHDSASRRFVHGPDLAEHDSYPSSMPLQLPLDMASRFAAPRSLPASEVGPGQQQHLQQALGVHHLVASAPAMTEPSDVSTAASVNRSARGANGNDNDIARAAAITNSSTSIYSDSSSAISASPSSGESPGVDPLQVTSRVNVTGAGSRMAQLPDKLTVSQGRQVRLLVVDDARSNRMFLVRALKRRLPAGSEIFEAEEGREGIDVYQRLASEGRAVDVVCMDKEMPVMDGYEATREMRQKLGFKGLLLGVTANAMEADVQMFREAGADGVVTKPVDVDQLVAAIKLATHSADHPGVDR